MPCVYTLTCLPIIAIQCTIGFVSLGAIAIFGVMCVFNKAQWQVWRVTFSQPPPQFCISKFLFLFCIYSSNHQLLTRSAAKGSSLTLTSFIPSFSLFFSFLFSIELRPSLYLLFFTFYSTLQHSFLRVRYTAISNFYFLVPPHHVCRCCCSNQTIPSISPSPTIVSGYSHRLWCRCCSTPLSSTSQTNSFNGRSILPSNSSQ